MADRRKLQGEIERCLKKVAEGVEAFEDTWKKVLTATNSNQKDKYESDLKKEIKKLQRLRDQIKTWLTSSDIKDKRSLQDARKIIETQMERFKVVEKETKTKAYSKEGLGAQKLDPAQREKDEITTWLTSCIETLNIQLDKFESEIDTINFSLKKKKNDKEKLENLEDLKSRHQKHKFHINHLEALLRMLDNDTVEVDQIKKIKDDVEYYLEYSHEPDFQENEYIYDEFNLGNIEDYLAIQQAAYQQSQLEAKTATLEEENSVISESATSTSTNSRSHSPCLENHSSEESKVSDSTAPSNAVQQSPSPASTNNVSSECSNPPSVSHSTTFQPMPSVINTSQASPFTSTAAPPAMPNNRHEVSSNHENIWLSSTIPVDEAKDEAKAAFLHHSNSPERHPPPSATHVPNLPTPASHPWSDSTYNHYRSMQEAELMLRAQAEAADQHLSNSSEGQQQRGELESCKNVSSVNFQSDVSRCYNSSVSLNVSSNSVISEDAQSSLKNLAERAIMSSGTSNNNLHNLQFSAIQNKGSQLTHNAGGTTPNDLFIEQSLSMQKPPPVTMSAEIDISQIFGTYPQNVFTEDQKHCLNVLSVACKNRPLLMDSQRYRHLTPGSPAVTPNYYPPNAPNSNTIEFFQRLSTETLFFIFYFLQGTKAQYLAAKALKSKSWRFHTMFMMWFQRHNEPKRITDDFEEGSYVYFDYEKWMQRKKENFTFEYKYLEDRDLN